VTGALVRTNTYDNAGNTLSDGGRTFTHNSARRTVSISGGAGMGEYSYDALGQWIRKIDAPAYLPNPLRNSQPLVATIQAAFDFPTFFKRPSFAAAVPQRVTGSLQWLPVEAGQTRQ